MRIKAINLNAFGAFKDVRRDFAPGYNRISLANEEGKSTTIEALAVSFFGYTKENKNSYLPNMVGRASCTMELSLDHEPGLISIHRESGTEGGVLRYLTTNEKIKGPVFPLLKQLMEGGGENFNEGLSREDFFITADNLREHRNVLTRAGKNDLGFFDAVDFRGPDIDELIRQRRNKMNAIYTNNKNSQARYRQLEEEREAVRAAKQELNDKNKELREEYESYQDMMPRLSQLKEEEKVLLAELREAEAELAKSEVFSAYGALLEEEEAANFKALADMPGLQNYELRARDAERAKERKEVLTFKLAAYSYDEEEEELLKLAEIEHSEGLNLRPGFANMLEYSTVKKKREELRSSLDDMEFYADEIDIEAAKRDADAYAALLGASRRLEERPSSPLLPAISFLLVVGFIALAYFLRHSMGLALSALGLALATLVISTIYFLTSGREKRERSLKREGLNLRMRNEFGELKKLSQIRTLIAEQAPLDERAVSYMDLVFKNYEAYVYHQRREAELLKEIRSQFAASPSTAFILNLKQDRAGALAEYYLSKASLIWAREMERRSLVKELYHEEERLKEVEEELSLMEAYYMEHFRTRDIGLIASLLDDKIRLDTRKEELMERAESMNIASELGRTLMEAPQHYSLRLEERRAELEEKRALIASLNDESLALSVKLSQKTQLSNRKYENYSMEDLSDLDRRLEEEQEELIKNYNKLAVEIAVLGEMGLIAKERVRPQFLERAGSFFRELAPESGLIMSMNRAGHIQFLQEETMTELPFTNLSSGTQAQFLLCLKLALLEELDEEGHYPLILDDAFMAYDAKRYRRATALLRSIAKKRQVLYFETLHFTA